MVSNCAAANYGGRDIPTVMGLILTPSSRCAEDGSSDSLCVRTCWPQRVFTKVVRPVPEAPQTIRQNWIPFLTFFFLRVLLSACGSVSSGHPRLQPDNGGSGSGIACVSNGESGVSYRRHFEVGSKRDTFMRVRVPTIEQSGGRGGLEVW